jgi:hypothetical protein
MRPLDLSSVETPRFPIPVSRSHPAEWYVRRRLSILFFLIGLSTGVTAGAAIILAGLV